MKFLVAPIFVVLMSCSSTRSVHSAGLQQNSTGAVSPSVADRGSRVTVYLGQRSLDEGDWAPVEDQATFGVEFAREPAGSTIGWEIGLLGSADETTVAGFDVEATTGELYGGVRKTFGSGVARPYVGGGLSFINAEVDVSGLGSFDDSSPAAYAHAGISFDVTPSFFLGLDLRLLLGSDMTIGGISGDADYTQLAVHLGWAF